MRTKTHQIGLFKRAVYDFFRFVARLVAVLLFDFRCHGRENLMPGAALVLSNHQSNFDPILVGLIFNDRLNYVARQSLFKNPLLAAIIRLLDAIELDRDRTGLEGLKETLRRLKADQKVLVFPEGTRTTDGRIRPLKPGFLAVARRSQVPLVPLAVSGAYESLPRGSMLPRWYPFRVSVGPVVRYEDYCDLEDAQALQLISKRLESSFALAESLRRR